MSASSCDIASRFAERLLSIASIDHEVLPIGVRTTASCDECNEGGDLVRVRKPAYPDLAHLVRSLIFRKRVIHAGVYPARCNRIDADTSGSVVLREYLHHVPLCRLGRVVVR